MAGAFAHGSVAHVHSRQTRTCWMHAMCSPKIIPDPCAALCSNANVLQKVFERPLSFFTQWIEVLRIYERLHTSMSFQCECDDLRISKKCTFVSVPRTQSISAENLNEIVQFATFDQPPSGVSVKNIIEFH